MNIYLLKSDSRVLIEEEVKKLIPKDQVSISYVYEKNLENIYNEEYYVKMAIAWLLSKCLVYFYEETVEFLTKTKLDKFTKNKSIQKAIESYRISDIRKKELRNLKQY